MARGFRPGDCDRDGRSPGHPGGRRSRPRPARQGRPAAQSGRVRLSCVPASPGNPTTADGRRAAELLARSQWDRRRVRRLAGERQAWSHAQLVERLDPSIEPLAAAFLLGQREEVEPEVNDAFARTGTTHLLAISGLHLQVLAVAMLFASRAMGLPRRPAYLAVGVLTFGYAVLVGPAPSVVRSTVMTVTFCLAAILNGLPGPPTPWPWPPWRPWASIPRYLFDIGCQLSFLAIAALSGWCRRPVALVRTIGEAIRVRFYGPFTPLDELERRLEPRWRKRLRRAGMDGRRRRGLDGDLAGGGAAGRL